MTVSIDEKLFYSEETSLEAKEGNDVIKIKNTDESTHYIQLDKYHLKQEQKSVIKLKLNKLKWLTSFSTKNRK